MQSLVRKVDFRRLVEKGHRLRAEAWLVVNYERNNIDELRLGCTMSRKVGSAVLRNRLRRWCREWFRKLESPQPFDINLLFLERKDKNFYKNLKHDDLNETLQDAYFKICKNN